MDEERLINLETKLAYQEETVRVLNEVVTELQLQVSDLRQFCRSLSERVVQLAADSPAKTTLAEEVPPHY